MNKNSMRPLLLALAIVYALQPATAQAWNLTHIAQALHNNRVTRPLAIIGITSAVCACSLLLYNRLNRHPDCAQTHIPPAAPLVQRPSFLSRIWRWFRAAPQIPPILDPVRQPAPHNTPMPILVPQPPIIPLAEQIMAPVAGYQAATAEQLATVPYFNEPTNLVEPATQFENPLDATQVTIQQVRVFNQFGDSAVNGHGTTCGYQAIKNVCGLIGLIHGRHSEEMLTGRRAASELLGYQPQGILRQSIILCRQRQALHNYLRSLLIRQTPLNTSPQEDPENMRIAYTRLIGIFIQQQTTTIEANGQADITPDLIVDFIARAKLPPRFQADADFIRNRANIERYIVLADPIHLTRADFNNAIQIYNKYLHEHANTAPIPENPIPEDGEMLEPEEITYALEEQRAHPNSAIARTVGNTPFFVVPSTETPAPAPGEEAISPLAVDENLLNIRNTIARGAIPQEPRTYAFALGTGDQNTGCPGHWIVMTLEMARNHRYTFANPASNRPSLSYGPAATVIRFLEGEHVGQLLEQPQPTQQQV